MVHVYYKKDQGPNFTRFSRRERIYRTNIWRSPYQVKFVSELHPTVQMNENRCFQMLDESIRQAKILGKQLAEQEEKEGKSLERQGMMMSCRTIAKESIVPQTQFPKLISLPTELQPIKTKKVNSDYVVSKTEGETAEKN